MIKNITAENFKKYGRVIEYSGKQPKDKNANLFCIVLRENKKSGWRIAHLVLRDRMIGRLEQHPGSFESFEPVRGRSLIYLAVKRNSEIECFHLDRPVILKKGVWHGVVAISPESEINITENADVECLFWKLKTPLHGEMNKLKFKPEAIIFDMDGVIIDSMPYHFLAWYEALRPLGVRVSCFDVYAKEGENWKKSLREFLRGADIAPTKERLEHVFRRRKKIFRKNFKRFIFKDAKEVLTCLKEKGYKLGLVTGTPSREVKKILPKNIYKLFGCIVAGDRVKRGKPHPEPYLTAAKAIGARPSGCVVVENAPFGVESAKKAGMFCIAVTTGLTKEYLKGADIVVNKLIDITDVIDKSCGK